MMKQEQPKGLQIKASDDVLKGVYANLMQISHSREEFIMDFMLAHPPAGQFVSRVITSPGHMKRINSALQENINLYEKQFGKINIAIEPETEIGFAV